jgi:hypothetical protein
VFQHIRPDGPEERSGHATDQSNTYCSSNSTPRARSIRIRQEHTGLVFAFFAFFVVKTAAARSMCPPRAGRCGPGRRRTTPRRRIYSGLRLRMGAASRAGVSPSPPASRPPAERGEKAERPLSPISPFPPISPPPTVVTHSADAGRSFRHRKNGKRLDSREGRFIIMYECVARPAGP